MMTNPAHTFLAEAACAASSAVTAVPVGDERMTEGFALAGRYTT
jgi:hypothetical protein